MPKSQGRKLAAIMLTDIVGYSALMHSNEMLAIELLEEHWELLRPLFPEFEGEEINTIGDAILVEFPSAKGAVECAVEIQRCLFDRNATTAEERHIRLRVGVHIGDVEHRHNNIFGDGVNIAARIEPFAPAGGICVSEHVYNQVRNKLDGIGFASLGCPELKNVSTAIEVYRLVLPWLKEDDALTALPARPARGKGLKSVAVLPFADISQEGDNEYFADGLAESLLHMLTQLKGLRVAARTSCFAFKGKNEDIRSIGRKLDVETVMEGSVRKAGNRVLITTQLINAEDGYHIWSERYDRELDDIFAVQEDIARAVTDALKVTLLGEEQKRLSDSPTDNYDAYDAYLLGRQRRARRTKATMMEAVKYFQQAIELDCDFAMAHVGLADTWLVLISHGLPREETLKKAWPAITRALELDEGSGDAYAARGLYYTQTGEFVKAETDYRRALELNPGSASTWNWYGHLLRKLRRSEETLPVFRKALKLNPMSAIVRANTGTVLEELGQFEEARGQYRKALEIDPGFGPAYWYLGWHYYFCGRRLDEAIQWLQRGLENEPDDPRIMGMLAQVWLDLGDDVEAETLARRAMELWPGGDLPNVVLALLSVYQRDTEAAVRHAKQALTNDPLDLEMLWIVRNADLDSGNAATARERYAHVYPSVFADHPVLDGTNIPAAVDVIPVLMATGEEQRADDLLKQASAGFSKIRRMGYFGFHHRDIEVNALEGRCDEALAALEQAVEDGWRAHWRLYLEHNPSLAKLRETPVFQDNLEAIRRDMAQQRENLAKQEASGI